MNNLVSTFETIEKDFRDDGWHGTTENFQKKFIFPLLQHLIELENRIEELEDGMEYKQDKVQE